MKGAAPSSVLSDALSLVLQPWPPPRVVARWSRREQKEVWDWVGREVLAANDHDDVERVQAPPCLGPWLLRSRG